MMTLMIRSWILLISSFGLIAGQSKSFSSFNPTWMSMNTRSLQTPLKLPFPQCVQSAEAAQLFQSNVIEQLFLQKLQEEDQKFQQERERNLNLKNSEIVDFEAVQLRSDTLNGALVARAAVRLSEDILEQLRCETNATISDQLETFLKNFPIPARFCAFNAQADCSGLTRYRTITGVCNNLQRPYQGSSQTAFARLLPAAYDDGISSPRSQSVLGGPLPSCREISLNMGSKPVFDTTFNNLFVAYGQFLIHDITLATPVTDSGRTPITSCTCESQDPSMCLVINIPPNDPFMAGQKCMSIPATAEAFSDFACTLGVKDQSNGNSHYIDLSATYGSTKATSHGLRLKLHGFLKTSKAPWAKFDLPPGQREGKTCVDGTDTQRCFAGGDSRLMENILLAGIQTQWIRIHNMLAGELTMIRPDWASNDDVLYEEVRHISSALHQRYIYEDWLPILIGRAAAQQFTGHQGLFSQYNPNIPGVIFNEAATSVLRLHTLVRDLLTRCKPNGEFIDQIWLRDVSAKCKYAYDALNNGLDSILCGSLFDFGFAGDANYAQEIHHRLFETTNNGKVKRHDIVSVNICRAREHGIPGYNAYREICGLRRAQRFEDFADSMNFEAIEKLRTIYRHPEDVDLFVGTNHETHVPGGLVGPVSACIIGTQMKHLKFGDRFFYTHEGQFTAAQLQAIKNYPYRCFICHTTDIQKVPSDAFRPPNDQTNPLQDCNECPILDLTPWNRS